MRWERADRLVPAAAVLLAFGAYAVTAGYAFVYDDVHVIQNNAALHSLANWRQIITMPWWGNALYRPLTQLTFALDWTVSHGDPRWFHAVNVLLHALTTALVYVFARGGLGTVGAGAAALVFAVHPVHVEAVANVVGRAEVLATCFTLLAALAYRADGALAAQGERNTWRRAATSSGTVLATALGLAAKETAFVIPGVLLLTDWFDGERRGERAGARWARHWVVWVASLALAFEWLWLRSAVMGEFIGVHPAPGLEGEGLGGRTLVMAPVVLEYLRLLFVPARLSADYSPDFLSASARVSLAGVAGLAATIVCTALAVRARRRAPMWTLGFAWIGGSLLIVCNLIVPTGVLLAERTLYLPSVGAALVVGWLVAWTEASWHRAGTALTAALVALGMVRTETRVPVWRDNARFFPQLVRDAPGSYRSFSLAGALAYGEGDRSRGEALVRRAILVYPLHPGTWETLGTELAKDGRWLEAARSHDVAYRLDTLSLLSGFGAVNAYLRAGMTDSAVSVARRMGTAHPYDFRYQAAMAEIASARGRPLEAMTWRRRVAWQFPDVWQYWWLTADTALQAGYCFEARRSGTRIRALKPGLSALTRLEARLRSVGCVP